MITVLDFVNNLGKVRTAAGWDVNICYIDKDADYPICGYVVNPKGVNNLYRWDKNGNPENLPLNHGMNLVPVVPITEYRMIDMKRMKDFDKVQDLVKSEIERFVLS